MGYIAFGIGQKEEREEKENQKMDDGDQKKKREGRSAKNEGSTTQLITSFSYFTYRQLKTYCFQCLLLPLLMYHPYSSFPFFLTRLLLSQNCEQSFSQGLCRLALLSLRK